MFENLTEAQQIFLELVFIVTMLVIFGFVASGFFSSQKKQAQARQSQGAVENSQRRRRNTHVVMATNTDPTKETTGHSSQGPAPLSGTGGERGTDVLSGLTEEQKLYYFEHGRLPSTKSYQGLIKDKLVALVTLIAFLTIRRVFGLYISDGLWDIKYHGAMGVLVIASFFLNVTGTLGSFVVNFLLFAWAVMMLF